MREVRRAARGDELALGQAGTGLGVGLAREVVLGLGVEYIYTAVGFVSLLSCHGNLPWNDPFVVLFQLRLAVDGLVWPLSDTISSCLEPDPCHSFQ